MKKKADDRAKYQKLASSMVPRPQLARNIAVAFVVGGLICTLGQAVMNAFIASGMTGDRRSGHAATMILIGVVLTGLSIYHHIGEFAGAGAAVPNRVSNTLCRRRHGLQARRLCSGHGSEDVHHCRACAGVRNPGGSGRCAHQVAFAGVNHGN